MTETINGLHSCKPGNEPVVGKIKSFVVQHMTSKKGKPYLKIKAATAENGGTPHRILAAEPTDFFDSWGNLSFNIEIEPAVNGQRSMEEPQNAPQSSVKPPAARSNGEDGVKIAREQLMRDANLMLLCMECARYVVMEWETRHETAKLSDEHFQALCHSFFIKETHEAWWSGQPVRESLTTRMPNHPLKLL